MGDAADTAREEAKTLCHSGDCPVVDRCLAWALSRGEQGVWGGTDEDERRSLSRRSKKIPTRLPAHEFVNKEITERRRLAAADNRMKATT